MILPVGEGQCLLSDFMVLLMDGSSKKGAKHDRMHKLLIDIANQLGLLLEVDRTRSSVWGLIDHVDLGVIKGGGTKCRRVAPGFKRAVAQVARSLRGSGVKRPGQVLATMHCGKRARRGNHVLSRSGGPATELFESWNYWLSMRHTLILVQLIINKYILNTKSINNQSMMCECVWCVCVYDLGVSVVYLHVAFFLILDQTRVR